MLKTKKITKIIKTAFLLCFLFAEFFGFTLNSFSASCTILPIWRNENGKDFAAQPTQVKTGTTYYAVATFTDCQGYIPSFKYYGGQYVNFVGVGTSQGLGGAITDHIEQRNATFYFQKEGEYYFDALANNGSPTILKSSGHIQSSATATNSPPAGGQPSQPTSPASPAGTAPPVAATPDKTQTTNPTDQLYNPLPETDLTSTLLLIAKGFLGIIGIWAAAFVIIGGFQLVMSSGNEEMVLKGKKTIMWAVLGLVIALLSFSIIAIVQNLLNANVQNVKSGMLEKNSKVAIYEKY